MFDARIACSGDCSIRVPLGGKGAEDMTGRILHSVSVFTICMILLL